MELSTVKKSSFTAMVLGTISGSFFSIGMCMAMIEEWNSFKTGIIFGSVGIILGIITVVVWRKMTGKASVKISGKGILTAVIGIAGALLLGIGMCFCMVWNKIMLGIVIGVIGIILLLSLIPLIKGIKD